MLVTGVYRSLLIPGLLFVALGFAQRDKLVLSDDEFASFVKGPVSAIWVTIVFGIGAIFLLESILVFIAENVVGITRKEGSAKAGRFWCDSALMVTFFVIGYDALLTLAPLPENATIAQTIHHLLFDAWHVFYGKDQDSHELMFRFIPSAVRLCVLQVCYEWKSLCDVYKHGDGLLFAAHHIGASLLAFIALNPFCNIYGIFYLGISEVSTFVLCLLVVLDKERGIARLYDTCKTALKVLGGSFALLFVVYRCIYWPVVSYYFWEHALNVLHSTSDASNGAGADADGMKDFSRVGLQDHPQAVIYLFLLVNVLLSLLQVVWLWEVICVSYKELVLGVSAFEDDAVDDKEEGEDGDDPMPKLTISTSASPARARASASRSKGRSRTRMAEAEVEEEAITPNPRRRKTRASQFS